MDKQNDAATWSEDVWGSLLYDLFAAVIVRTRLARIDDKVRADRDAWLDVAAEVLVSRVRQAAGGEASRLCDEPSSLADYAERFPGVNVSPAPLFDQVYADEVVRVCEQGGELPPPPIEGNLPPLPR